MSNQSSAQEDILNKYLRNQLSEQERAEFEIRMMEDPELLNAVQRQGEMISDLRTSQEAKINRITDSSADDIAPNVSFLRNFSGWIQQPLSMAASLLIVIGAVFSFQNPDEPVSVTEINTGLVQMSQPVVLQSFRGGTDTIAINSDPPVSFVIEVDPTNAGPFEVTMIDVGTETAVSSLLVNNPIEPGLIRMQLTRELQGEFLIQVTSPNDDAVLTFPIEFIN